ncbi:unnamed protein product, partial [Symbiodinium sp. KB8]
MNWVSLHEWSEGWALDTNADGCFTGLSMADSDGVGEEVSDASCILRCLQHAQQALCHDGDLDAKWTNILAEAIMATDGLHGRVDSIVRQHGWLGNQFSTPPRMSELMKDLERTVEPLIEHMEDFPPGQEVVVVGHQKYPEHNGKLGKVLDQAAAEGHFRVEIDEGSRTIIVKKENMQKS